MAPPSSRTGRSPHQPRHGQATVACSLASLSVGAAAIHFAVTFEHFNEYSLYGVFFLVLAWPSSFGPPSWSRCRRSPGPGRSPSARLPAKWSRSGVTPLAARRLVVWLWLGIAGNAVVLANLLLLGSIDLPIGPEPGRWRPGAAWTWCGDRGDLLVAVAATVLVRPGSRPARSGSAVRRGRWPARRRRRRRHRRDYRGHDAGMGGLGPAGMASPSSGGLQASPSLGGLQGGMGDMGTTDGRPDMQMYENKDGRPPRKWKPPRT